jgi:DNA (cytosine-5)-methyltransferase 1
MNAYCGIGGNRKLWGNEHDITAIELDPKIASVYKDFFPNDDVVVADAHKYLEQHYEEYDFIWSSPPCPTHSIIRNVAGVGRGQNKPVYPDMRLYQEIIFLNQVWHSKGTKFRGLWCVENVISYYEPLIAPQKIGRHYFWSNFFVPPLKTKDAAHHKGIKQLEENKGFDLSKYSFERKDRILRNCVQPELGLHILKAALNPIKTQLTLF